MERANARGDGRHAERGAVGDGGRLSPGSCCEGKGWKGARLFFRIWYASSESLILSVFYTPDTRCVNFLSSYFA